MNIANIIDKVHCSDCLEFMRQMPDDSVHCVVTSPPYWDLRDYGVDGQLGLEKTPEKYIAKMVEVFREVRRILRKDGTLWLNMGDSYIGGGRGGGGSYDSERPGWEQCKSKRMPRGQGRWGGGNMPAGNGLKPKDLCMMPHRLAMALQADGWWIRSDIVWSKPNPMPESVTDRPTKAHEYLFLCTKNSRYFYDADAIREDAKDSESYTGRRFRGPKSILEAGARPGKSHTLEKGNEADGKTYAKVNKRSVWTIPTEATNWKYCRTCKTIYIGKERSRIKVIDDKKICPTCKKTDWVGHFATFPQDLVEPCIKAGTSEKGCCPDCGAPWVRVKEANKGGTTGQSWHDHSDDIGKGNAKKQTGSEFRDYEPGRTIGWQPSCKCGKDPVPCLVYDLFMGAGTVGLVAYKLRRHYCGTELNPDYCKIARKRIQAEKDKYGLFKEK